MEFNLKAMSLGLFLLVLLILNVNSVPAGPDQTSGIPVMPQNLSDQPVQNVVFRLLAIENYFNDNTKSAEDLIKNLRMFSNWHNGTLALGFQYSSHIHLLSNINHEQIDPQCQPFYRGNATKTNVIEETTSFLSQSLPEDADALSVRVFYYAGYSNKAVSQGNTSYYMALDEPLYDWELNQTLSSSQSQSVVIILDTSYAGGYITRLASPGRVILAACNPVETSIAGWFTGSENAFYPNGTDFGLLGIIGATQAGRDIDNDGWLSTDEIFRFAWQTLTDFASNQTDPKTNNTYSLHPWASYGVAGGGIPLAQRNQSQRYPGNSNVCIPQSILPSSSRYDWSQYDCPMYRQSLSRTGYASTIGPETPDLLWVSSLNSSVTSSPAVSDGMIFVGTVDGRVHAMDMKTGEESWSFNTDSATSTSPAVSDGIVFIGTENPGRLYALDAYTGYVRWIFEIPTEAPTYSSPAIVNKMVFIGCSDGYVRCVSEFEGELLWETHVGGGQFSSPAIVDNTIFIVRSIGRVHAIDMLTGRWIWSYQTRWSLYSSPAVADGLVFVGAENDDKMFALEQETGKLVWDFPTSGWLTSPAVDSHKGLVIAGCRDTRVYCLEESTGFLKWQYIGGPNYLSAPTICANGLVFIGSSDGNLYSINEETGEEVWKYTVDSPIVSSPIIIYEHVIVASQEGKIFCFGPQFATHNIALSNANVSHLKLKPGESLEINYTIENYGNDQETITLTIGQNTSNVWLAPQYSEPTAIYNQNITLAIEANLTYEYYWNTSDTHPGLYSLSVQAQLVPDESDASDNTFIIDAIMIAAPEDLDANGQINIIDISIVATVYGSVFGEPNWNQDADVNKDNIINILDISLIAIRFGETYA